MEKACQLVAVLRCYGDQNDGDSDSSFSTEEEEEEDRQDQDIVAQRNALANSLPIGSFCGLIR